MTPEPLQQVGGRKFASVVIGIVAISALAAFDRGGAAYASIAGIVVSFLGANTFLTRTMDSPGAFKDSSEPTNG